MCDACIARFERRPADVDHDVGDAPLAYRAAVYHYGGEVRRAVQLLKYSRATALAEPLGRLLATGAVELGLLSADAFVPVPIHWRRRCWRGFNQSELLAEALPADHVRPELLRRLRHTRPQVGLKPEERLRNVADAFEASPQVVGMSVLLIDDVATTGGTALACAVALRRAGARQVGVLSLAAGGE